MLPPRTDRIRSFFRGETHLVSAGVRWSLGRPCFARLPFRASVDCGRTGPPRHLVSVLTPEFRWHVSPRSLYQPLIPRQGHSQTAIGRGHRLSARSWLDAFRFGGCSAVGTILGTLGLLCKVHASVCPWR